MTNEYREVSVRKHDRNHPRKPNTTIPVRRHQRRVCVCDPKKFNQTSMMAGKPPTKSKDTTLANKDGQYILTKYLPVYWQSDTSTYYRFENLPVSEGRKIMTGDPNIDPKDNQNRSPPAKEMIRLAGKHNGTLEGYVIPVSAGRDDARISIDGFTIRASKDEAMKLRKELKRRKHSEQWEGETITWTEEPDEFNEVRPRYWRFWWD